ncbi:MAG TPA: carbohydrate-binding module family 20 domain-containing protein, partial [Candidatus Ozemobacteraceae bacterium]|nr:carbohydrate-binding module family 20 domain-containing protein [Candidatus Ozemobacteraceae bacterium]
LLTARGIPTLCYGDETPLVSTSGVFGTNRPDMKFTTESETRELVKSLISLRKEHPALTAGVQQHLGMADSWYAFSRLLPDQAAIVAINNSTHSVRLSLPLPGRVREPAVVTDLLTLAEGRVCRDKLNVQVAPREAVVFIVHPERENGFADAHRLAEAAGRDLYAHGRVRVTFRLTTPPAAVGDVYLCGALPALGAWNPDEAVPCVRDSRGRWSAAVDLPARAVTDFKFFVKAGGKVIWPDGWWNYTLEVPTSRRLTVEKPWMQ